MISTYVPALPRLSNYENYWKLYQKYLLNKDRSHSALSDLFQACHLLTRGIYEKNTECMNASVLSRTTNLLAHEVAKTSDLEFFTRLQENLHLYNNDKEVVNLLFIYFYSLRYHTVYSDYSVRYLELRRAFSFLLNHPVSLNKEKTTFIDRLVEKVVSDEKGHNPQETIHFLVDKMFVSELKGRDLLVEVMAEYEVDKKPNKRSPKKEYPFKILPKSKLEKSLETINLAQNGLVDDILSTVDQHIKKIYCKATKLNHYRLELTPDQVQDLDQSTICFVDKTSQSEIGRITFEENQMKFYGYGDVIHLVLRGTLDVQMATFSNQDGEITVQADWKLHQPFYLASDSNHLILKGIIQTTEEARFDIRGDIEFDSRAGVQAKAIVVRANDLQLRGRIVSDTYCQLDLQTMTMAPESECSAGAGIKINSRSLKDIRGRLVTLGFIQVDVDNAIYIHGSGTIQGKTGIVVNAYDFLMTDKASIKTDNLAKFHVKNRLMLEKFSDWSAQDTLIQCKSFRNSSPFVVSKNALIRSEEDTINYPTGVMSIHDHLQLTGGSVWNGGQINYGLLKVKLNKLFVHGISQVSELWHLNKIFNQAQLKGGDIQIIAGVVLNVLSTLNVRTLTLSAIVEINLGMTIARSERKSRLMSLDLGINMPNIASVCQDIYQVLSSVENSDFQSALKAIFSWEGFVTLTSFARWVIRMCLPSLSKGVDIGWSSLMLLYSTPKLFSEFQNLYERGENVEKSDIYSLLATSCNFVNQAVALESQIESSLQGETHQESKASDAKGHPEEKYELSTLLPTLAFDFASLLFPANTYEAIVEARIGGLHFTSTLIDRSAFSCSWWCSRLGLTITDIFYRSYEQNNATASIHLSKMGHTLNESGVTAVITMTTNVNHQKESGRIFSKNTEWRSQMLDDRASIQSERVAFDSKEAVVSGVVDADLVEVHSDTHLTLTESAHLGSPRSTVVLICPHTSLAGFVRPERLVLNMNEFDQFDKLLLHQDEFKDIFPSKNLILHTDHKIDFSHKIEMDYCLTLLAPVVYFNSDFHSVYDIDIETLSGEIVTHSANVRSEATLSFTAKTQYVNQLGKVSANKFFINTQGKVINTDGTLQADRYLQIHTVAGNVENQCVETEEKSKYGKVKKYSPGHILGGTGEGIEGGIGLNIDAGGLVVNDASEIKSIGSNYIFGRLGVVTNARSYQYVSFMRKTKTFYGKEVRKMDVTTKVQPAVIQSTRGKNTVVSQEGEINACSTQFIAPGQTDLVARGNVNLTGLVTENKHYESHSNLYGLLRHKKTELTQSVQPTQVISMKDVNIISDKNVVIAGAIVCTPGKITLEGDNVIISAPILSHSTTEESRRFGINFPSLSGLNDFHSLLQPQNISTFAQNLWMTGVEDMKLVTSVLAGIREGSLQKIVSSVGAIDVDYTRRKSRVQWQTLATNVGINCGTLDIRASNDVRFSNGVPVLVSGDASIHARRLLQGGVSLETKTSRDSQKLEVSLSPQANITATLSFERSVNKSVMASNQLFKVKGLLFVNVKEWKMDSATTNAGKLSASVDSFTQTSHSDKNSSNRRSLEISAQQFSLFARKQRSKIELPIADRTLHYQ